MADGVILMPANKPAAIDLQPLARSIIGKHRKVSMGIDDTDGRTVYRATRRLGDVLDAQEQPLADPERRSRRVSAIDHRHRFELLDDLRCCRVIVGRVGHGLRERHRPGDHQERRRHTGDEQEDRSNHQPLLSKKCPPGPTLRSEMIGTMSRRSLAQNTTAMSPLISPTHATPRKPLMRTASPGSKSLSEAENQRRRNERPTSNRPPCAQRPFGFTAAHQASERLAVCRYIPARERSTAAGPIASVEFPRHRGAAEGGDSRIVSGVYGGSEYLLACPNRRNALEHGGRVEIGRAH